MHEPQLHFDEDGKPYRMTTFIQGEHLRITSKALQQLLGMKEATVTRRLGWLEEHGVIEKPSGTSGSEGNEESFPSSSGRCKDDQCTKNNTYRGDAKAPDAEASPTGETLASSGQDEPEDESGVDGGNRSRLKSQPSRRSSETAEEDEDLAPRTTSPIKNASDTEESPHSRGTSEAEHATREPGASTRKDAGSSAGTERRAPSQEQPQEPQEQSQQFPNRPPEAFADELAEVHQYTIERDEQLESAMRGLEREGQRYLRFLTRRADEEKELSQAQTSALAVTLGNLAGLGKERYQVAGGICSGMFRYDYEATESFIGVLCAARERGELTEKTAWASLPRPRVRTRGPRAAAYSTGFSASFSIHQREASMNAEVATPEVATLEAESSINQLKRPALEELSGDTLSFEPSGFGAGPPEPRGMIAVNVSCAETDEEAAWLRPPSRCFTGGFTEERSRAPHRSRRPSPNSVACPPHAEHDPARAVAAPDFRQPLHGGRPAGADGRAGRGRRGLHPERHRRSRRRAALPRADRRGHRARAARHASPRTNAGSRSAVTGAPWSRRPPRSLRHRAPGPLLPYARSRPRVVPQSVTSRSARSAKRRMPRRWSARVWSTVETRR